jgi:hypothetical protein
VSPHEEGRMVVHETDLARNLGASGGARDVEEGFGATTTARERPGGTLSQGS